MESKRSRFWKAQVLVVSKQPSVGEKRVPLLQAWGATQRGNSTRRCLMALPRGHFSRRRRLSCPTQWPAGPAPYSPSPLWRKGHFAQSR